MGEGCLSSARDNDQTGDGRTVHLRLCPVSLEDSGLDVSEKVQRVERVEKGRDCGRVQGTVLRQRIRDKGP